MKSLLLSAALALSVAGAAQAQTVVGPLAAFDSIELKHGGRVILRQGPQQRVTLVQGSLAHTRIEVRPEHGRRWLGSGKPGRLEIDTCARGCPNNYELVVVVTSPRFDAVAVENGGAIRAEGAFTQRSSIAAAIEGGGAIDIRAIKARDVAAAIDGGGRITTGPARSLAVAIDGGGEVLYEGDPMLVSAVDGGGSVRKISARSR